MISMISACAMFSEVTPSTKQLAVKAATFKVLDGDIDRAETLVSWIDEAIPFIETEPEARLDFLLAEFRARIPWDELDIEKQLIAEAVINQIADDLKNEFPSNLLTPDQRIRLINVLNWSREAAKSLL